MRKISRKITHGEELVIGLFGKPAVTQDDDIWTRRMNLEKKDVNTSFKRASLGKTNKKIRRVIV